MKIQIDDLVRDATAEEEAAIVAAQNQMQQNDTITTE